MALAAITLAVVDPTLASAQVPGQLAERPTRQAQQADRGRDDRFDEALRAYREGQVLAEALRWEDALPHFRRSHELYPNVANSFGLARALHEVHRWLEARAQYESFLRDFSQASEEFREGAHEYLQRIAARRRTIRLLGVPRDAGLRMRVNGVNFEVGPTRPLVLEVFERNVAITLDSATDGRFSWDAEVPPQGGIDVDITFSAPAGGASFWGSPTFWTIATTLLVAGATTSGILIYRARNTLDPRSNRVIEVGP
jgi:tetratricopeptide (TPR) repeat protein